MTHRRRAGLVLGVGIILAAAVVGLLPTSATRPKAARAEPTQPNILVIVTDDQRSQTLSVMPKTKRFFGEGGTTYTNGMVTTPLCCPSRSTIFSGRYAHNHGVTTNEPPGEEPIVDQRATFQRYLNDAGYLTAIDGKMLNNWSFRDDPPNWDRWALFAGGNNSGPDGYFDQEFNVRGTVKTMPGYTTDVLSDLAVKDLGAFEQQDNTPWLLYVATQAPHAPFLSEPDYDGAPVSDWNGNPAVRESDRSDKPPWTRWGFTLERGVELRQQQLNTLRSVDDLVGRLRNKLDALGETPNTLAVFTSDNGFLWGEHGIGADKRFPYLPTYEVPFMVRWPGRVAAGVKDPALVANVDLAPTFLDAAGISPTLVYPFDGRSLLGPPARSRLLLEYYRSPDRSSVPSWAAIRTPTYQYTEWYQDDLTTITFREYYDLVADPWQLVNILKDGDPTNNPPLAALHQQLTGDRACVGTTCP